MTDKNHEDVVSLSKELERVKVHDHVGFFYESPAEWQAFIAAYIKSGLERHEKCYYIFDTHTIKQIRSTLKEYGLDIVSAETSGQLVLLHGSKIFFKDGIFDANQITSIFITETEKAVQEGYSALRITGETGWAAQGLAGKEEILDFESKLNRLLSTELPCLVVCQYNHLLLGQDLIKKLILAHPRLIRDNHVYTNYFYNPSEKSPEPKPIKEDAQDWFTHIIREDNRERDLQDKVQKFKLLFQESPNPILIVNENGVYLDANKAALKFFDCSLEELSGQTIWDNIPPESPDKAKLESMLIFNPRVFEFKCSIKGEIRDVSLHAIPFAAGNKNIIYYTIWKDITEHKRIEERNRQLAAIVESSDDAIYSLNLEGMIMNWNQSAETIYGYSAPEIIGQPAVRLSPPEYHDEALGNIEKIKRGEHIRHFETIRQRKDGRPIHVSITTSPIKNSAGEITGASIIARDISDRKRLEEMIKNNRTE